MEKQPNIITNIIIPQCCREGWATCPHSKSKKVKSKKKNIGL